MHQNKVNDINNGYITITRKRKPRVIIGTATVKSGSLKAAEKKTDIHVYKLHPETTIEKINFFFETKFGNVICENLNSKRPDKYTSYKINIHEKHYEEIINSSIWVEGIRIKVFLRKY